MAKTQKEIMEEYKRRLYGTPSVNTERALTVIERQQRAERVLAMFEEAGIEPEAALALALEESE